MSLFQIGSVLFSLFMFYVTRIHTIKSRLSVLESSAWYSLWFMFATLALFPFLLEDISEFLVFDRVFDLLVVAAFMVIVFIMVVTYFRYREMKIELEKLTRFIAKESLVKKLKK